MAHSIRHRIGNGQRRHRRLATVLTLVGLAVAAGCGSLPGLGTAPEIDGYGDVARGLPDDSQIAQDPASALLLEAVARGRLDVVLMAIDQGAVLEAREPARLKTAAMLAAERGDVDALVLLIALGADLAARSEDGWMALHHGAARDRSDAIRVMIAGGAEPDGREADQAMTPLMIAALLGNTNAVAALLDGGADISAKAAEGSTALHFAAASRDRDAPVALSELVVRGADPDVARDDGWTPLMVALAGGNPTNAALLLDLGADPDIETPDGVTARRLADERGYEALSRRLQA